MGFGGDLRRSGFAGPDRPDRLVGDDDRRRGSAGFRQGPRVRRSQDFVLSASRSASTSPTQTIGRRPAERGLELLVDQFIGFGEILPAFAVAEDHVGWPIAFSITGEISPV